MLTANGLKYEMEFEHGLHFIARALPENDGVLLHYEFINESGPTTILCRPLPTHACSRPCSTTCDWNERMSTALMGSGCWRPTCLSALRCRSTDGCPIITEFRIHGRLTKIA